MITYLFSHQGNAMNTDVLHLQEYDSMEKKTCAFVIVIVRLVSSHYAYLVIVLSHQNISSSIFIPI